jgi:hypothetical protein
LIAAGFHVKSGSGLRVVLSDSWGEIMKSSRFILFPTLLLIIYFIYTPIVRADEQQPDAYQLRDFVDSFFTGVGTQSVDPVFATALSAAPDATKGVLLARVNTLQQQVLIELDSEPPPTSARSAELDAKMERLQALQKALAGNPEPLRQLQRTLPHSPTGNTPIRSNVPNDEPTPRDEKDMLDLLIARLTRQVERIEQRWQGDEQKIKKLQLAIKYSEDKVRNDFQVLRLRYSADEILRKQLREFCDKSAKEQQTAGDNLAAATALAAHAHAALAIAEARAISCKSPADAAAVDAAVKDARQKAQSARRAFNEANAGVDLAHTFADKSRAAATDYQPSRDAQDSWVNGAQGGIQNLGMEVNELIARLSELEAVGIDAGKLQRVINDEFIYWKKRFPKTSQQLSFLSKRLAPELFRSPLSKAKIERLRAVPGDLQNEFNGIDLIDKKRPLPSCDVDPSVKSRLTTTLAEVEAAEAAVAGAGRFNGMAADCRKMAAYPPAPPASPQPPSQTAQPSVTPQRQSSGAIFIHGKASLSSGESTRYTASDQSGYHYGNGLTWQTTDDAIVGIDPLTGQAVARRKGKATLIAHHPQADRAAFLTVEVDPADDWGLSQGNVSVNSANAGGGKKDNWGLQAGNSSSGSSSQNQPVMPIPTSHRRTTPPSVQEWMHMGEEEQRYWYDAVFARQQQEQVQQQQNRRPSQMEGQLAEQERQRQSEDVERARQEQEQAAMNLLGMVSGMQQNLNALRNPGGNRIAQPAPLSGGVPSGHQAMMDQMGRYGGGGQIGSSRGFAAASGTGQNADAPVSPGARELFIQAVNQRYTQRWYPYWCPRLISGCSIVPSGAKAELVNWAQNATKQLQIDRYYRLLDCYDNCVMANPRNETRVGQCRNQCKQIR